MKNEGPIALNNCLINPTKCNKGATEYCLIRISLAKLREELIHKFRNISLKMLLENKCTIGELPS